MNCGALVAPRWGPRAVDRLALLCAVVSLLASCEPRPDRAQLDYNWDVVPILSQNCFACHGNGVQKAGLRLDMPQAAYGKIPDDPDKRAIVPGHPEKSELVRRITSTDPDYRMPPKERHNTLTAGEVSTLTTWIEQGAKYQEHWAYVAPREIKPPLTSWDKQAANAIDRYVYARLAKTKRSPSKQADRETLINRVYLDLTGLPPNLDEVDAFLSDKRADAYEQVVDRLLTSPAYAEQMAETWLDVARYSETDGFLDDLHGRLFYPYRDWVISAFAHNMRYNEFVTWQLAGDKLPHANREQLLATAFGRMGKRSTENGIIDEEYRVEYVDERVELVGKAFLGLTVGCARCHDHKYDAIKQKDYYSLGGFFNSLDERGSYASANSGLTQGPTLDWPTAEQSAALAATQREIAARIDDLRRARLDAAQGSASAALPSLAIPQDISRQIQASLDRAEVAYYPLDEAMPGPIEDFKVLRPAPAAPPRDARVKALAAEGLPGAAPARKTPKLPSGVVENDLQLTPSATPGVGPGGLERAVFVPGVKGNAFLVKDNRGFLAQGVGWYERGDEFSFDLWIKPRAGPVYEDATVVNHQDHTVYTGDSGYTLNLQQNHLRFDLNHISPYNMLSVATMQTVPAGAWTHVSVTYDGSSRADGLRIYLNGAAAPLEIRKDNLTRSTLPTLMAGSLDGDFYGFSFGKRFRAETFSDGALDEIRIFNRALTPIEIAYLHTGQPPGQSPSLQSQLLELAVLNDDRVKRARVALSASIAAETRTESSIPQIMIMKDADRVRATFILDHGLYDKPTEQVQPGVIERVLAFDKRLPRDRLGLAGWLTDPKNPLTARVFVNRLWDKHFGIGIVETVDDFGTQGAHPSNPELLDWLAVEFVRSGWDVRHLQKLIVMSATYRQSSDTTETLASQDPRNQLLAHGPRFRMPFESIRDNALAASGLLVKTVGGPSAYPYQPDGVWEAVTPRYGYPVYVPEDDVHRRSLYSFVKRSAELPNAVVFDFADRNVSTVRRRVSNTPLQALVLLNDPQFIETYRVLSQRVMHMSDDEPRQIQTLFRLVMRRFPTQDELALLIQYHAQQAQHFASQPDKALALLRIGVESADSALDTARLAAMSMVAGAVMNLPDAYSIR